MGMFVGTMMGHLVYLLVQVLVILNRKRFGKKKVTSSFHQVGGVWVSTRFLGPIGILLSAYADIGMVAATAGAYDDFDAMRNQLIYYDYRCDVGSILAKRNVRYVYYCQ